MAAMIPMGIGVVSQFRLATSRAGSLRSGLSLPGDLPDEPLTLCPPFVRIRVAADRESPATVFAGFSARREVGLPKAVQPAFYGKNARGVARARWAPSLPAGARATPQGLPSEPPGGDVSRGLPFQDCHPERPP